MSAINNTRSAAWEDRITWRVEDNVLYLKELGDDSTLQKKLQTNGALVLLGGFVVVRGKDDKDDGASSDIVEYVQGTLKAQAGFRLKSSEGMQTGERVWVYISIKDRSLTEKKDNA